MQRNPWKVTFNRLASDAQAQNVIEVRDEAFYALLEQLFTFQLSVNIDINAYRFVNESAVVAKSFPMPWKVRYKQLR